MVTFIIIVVILFFIFRKKKPKAQPHNYYDSAKASNKTYETSTSRFRVTISESQSDTKPMDDSIIDVGSQSQKIDRNYGLPGTVPYWSHSYVYSYNELRYATAAQQKFYFSFKDKFLNGEYPDLEGNSNYAFIL